LLVKAFLTGGASPDEYLDDVAAGRGAYDGFSVLAGDGRRLVYFSNRGESPQPVVPGVHALSNALLDTPWPKVERAKSALVPLLDRGKDAVVDGVLALLADRTRADDRDLPHTGVSLDWERCLSAAFIASPTYGTRCSTVLLIDRQGRVTFFERSFDHGNGETRDAVYNFTLSNATADAP
jgi:uncharacterized protein with NRDE domain